jgi:sugar lactone lactonase YvrE
VSERIEAVANYHCLLGENPLWNEREGRIYWEDIETGRLFRADHYSGEHECFYQGPVVGGFTFQEDGSLLLFEQDRIAVLSATGERRVLAEGIDSGMTRWNEVIADPEGRVFAGTIGKNDEIGGLFRVDHDGSVTSIVRGTGCGNGMGFSADLTTFYWTCSTTRRIYRFDYDRDSGALSNQRIHYQAPEAEGTPDGMAIDAEDGIWTARYGGSTLLKLAPNTGTLEGELRFPVPAVSSVTFGGPALDTLYVTTAGGKPDDPDSPDGTLYRVPVAVRGRLEYRSRIRL